MRKLIIIAAAFLLTAAFAGCSASINVGTKGTDKNQPTSVPTAKVTGNSGETPAGNLNADSGGKLNPPDWLIGTWENKDSDQIQTFTVTAHNVSESGGNLDFTWQIENVGLDVKETADGDKYSLSYSTDGNDVTYSYEKQSDGTVKRILTASGMDIPKIFTKK